MNPEKACEFWADIIAKNSMQKKEKRIFEERERESLFLEREMLGGQRSQQKTKPLQGYRSSMRCQSPLHLW